MGRAAVAGMLEMSKDLDTVLRWHLTSNHYPPLPMALLPLAKAAIEHANEGDLDAVLNMPAELSFRNRRVVTVREAIVSMHLDEFLTPDDG